MSEQVEVVNHPSWTHFVVIMVIFIATTAGGYCMGLEAGKLKGALAAIKSNPPNSYNGSGPVTVDQSTKHLGYMFGLKPAKSWGIGICHD